MADVYLCFSQLVWIPLASKHDGTLHRIYDPALRGLQHRELRILQRKIVFSLEILFHRYVRDDLTSLSLAKVKLILTGILLGDPENFEPFAGDA